MNPLNLLALFNWLLSQGEKLPAAMQLLEATVDLFRKWSELLTGSPAASPAFVAMQASALSADETVALGKLTDRLKAITGRDGAGKNLVAMLPYLKILLSLAGVNPVVSGILEKLFGVVVGTVSAQDLEMSAAAACTNACSVKAASDAELSA